MITGLETVAKFTPLISIAVIAILSFGSLRTSVEDMRTIQAQQYQQVMQQIDRLSDKIDAITSSHLK